MFGHKTGTGQELSGRATGYNDVGLLTAPDGRTYAEAKLDPRRFLRTHRSWIVNLDFVKEARTQARGGWSVVTRCGLSVPVGAQYRESLLRVLG